LPLFVAKQTTYSHSYTTPTTPKTPHYHTITTHHIDHI
jgi:hypothetical protein